MITVCLTVIFLFGQSTIQHDSLTVVNDVYEKLQNEPVGLHYILEESTYVKIELFNVMGKSLGNLFEGIQKAGRYNISKIEFEIPNGVYFSEVTVGDNHFSSKAMIINNEFARFPIGPRMKINFIDSTNSILLDSVNSATESNEQMD